MASLESVPYESLEKFGSSASERSRTPEIGVEQLEVLCQGDETLQELLAEMLDYCARYTETVCKFEQMNLNGQQTRENGELETADQYRTRIHEATIDSINILARNLTKKGKDGSWIKPIAAQSRAGYGRFALTTTFSRLAGTTEA